MTEKWEIAEKIVKYAKGLEEYVHDIDIKFECTVFACGPSGYVGCSHECRGSGRRRRSGHMLDMASYLNDLGRKKDRAIITMRPVVLAFEELKNTRTGHIIYYRLGRNLSSQEYGERFGYSRRHSRRIYIKALNELYDAIYKNNGESLIEKFNTEKE